LKWIRLFSRDVCIASCTAVFVIRFVDISAEIRAPHAVRKEPQGGKLHLGIGRFDRGSKPLSRLGLGDDFLPKSRASKRLAGFGPMFAGSLVLPMK